MNAQGKMRLKGLVLASAVAAALAACGGGSSSTSTPSSLTLSGTAATGLAIANSSVSVKCQGGSGTATTKADGTYTVTVTGATLPCALEVTANGETLRSVVSGTGTSATANITPLTELLVAALLQQNPDALVNGAPSVTTVTSDTLNAAKQAVVDFLRANDIDVSALPSDFVGTTLTAATDSNPSGGDAQDHVLDALKAAIPNIADATSAITTAVAASGPTSSISAAAECPAAKSGKYTLINYKGEVSSATVDFTQKTIVIGSTAPSSFTTSSTYPCEFSGGTITANFASSGLAIYKDTTNKVIGIALPYQAFNKSAIFGDTYNMSGYFANNSGPAAINASQPSGSYAPPNAQFGTMKIKTDGTAIVCGATNYSTSSDPAACPSTTSTYNAQTADFTGPVNTDGSVTISSPDDTGVTSAFSYVAPNGKKLMVLANIQTHTFLLVAKQEPIDTTKIEPNSVWYQVQGYTGYSGINNTGTWTDNAVIASGTNAVDLTTLTATQGKITQHFDDGVTPERVDTMLWNTTTGSDVWNGMRHRNKDTTVTPNISPRTGMSVVGMGFSTNGSVNGGTTQTPTAPSTASFTLSVKRAVQ